MDDELSHGQAQTWHTHEHTYMHMDPQADELNDDTLRPKLG